MKNILLSFLLVALFQQTYAQHSIIPAPVNYESTNSVFVLDNLVSLNISTDDKQVEKRVTLFQKFLENYGIKVAIKKGANLKNADKAIIVTLLKKENPTLGSEGYTLEVNEKR